MNTVAAGNSIRNTAEQKLSDFVVNLQFKDLPDDVCQVIRYVVLAVSGTAIAGAQQEGVGELREHLLQQGGTRQATMLVYGDKVPAQAAAQFNATLCRALDYCDAMAPGPHFGASLIPVALAASELRDECRGEEFITAIAAGLELGARLNLQETQYDGFDPTGVVVVLAAAATASRCLLLTSEQTRNALGLALNRCGGSFQSHVDGSLGVRFVQGWVAEAGLQCALLAQRGITGPDRFLSGHYGYAHLYGRNTFDCKQATKNLSGDWLLSRVMFKRYPSCGATQGLTDLLLSISIQNKITSDDIQEIEIRLGPYSWKLVGEAFSPGANPRVDAQFSAAWCAANAVINGCSRLEHFNPEQVTNPATIELASRVRVLPEKSLEDRGHSAVNVTVFTKHGARHYAETDISPGFPGAPLTRAQHLERFDNCIAYAPHTFSGIKTHVPDTIDSMQYLPDIRTLITQLIATG